MLHKIGDHVAFYCLRMKYRDREAPEYGGNTAAQFFVKGRIVGPSDPGMDAQWKILQDGWTPKDQFYFNRDDWELLFIQDKADASSTGRPS